ncbi:hypothetical protein OH492_12270 [Vibrio chagasii]|nr:hypothetical protein [Vibrio chagasii]
MGANLQDRFKPGMIVPQPARWRLPTGYPAGYSYARHLVVMQPTQSSLKLRLI